MQIVIKLCCKTDETETYTPTKFMIKTFAQNSEY